MLDENAHFNGYADLNFLNIFSVDPLFGVSYNMNHDISFFVYKQKQILICHGFYNSNI